MTCNLPVFAGENRPSNQPKIFKRHSLCSRRLWRSIAAALDTVRCLREEFK